MPNYSNMSHETQECLLLDDIICHVNILNLSVFAYILLTLKVTSIVNLPNEIIEMINRQAICTCSSDFTWPNHISCVYNIMYNVKRSFLGEPLLGEVTRRSEIVCLLI